MPELRPSPAVVVRPYQPSDQAGVEWLYSRTPPWGRTYARPQSVPEDLRQISKYYLACFVAVEQDRDGEAVIGLTAIGDSRVNPEPPLPSFLKLAQPCVRFHHVLVAPERWRLGIGRTLTQAGIEWAREMGYGAVVLETTTEQKAAAALYESLNFANSARSKYGAYEIMWFTLVL